MGFRRLRGRLDQMQGRANSVADLVTDLVLDLKDGFGIKIVRGEKSPVTAIWDFVRGVDKELDLFVLVDPKEDAKRCP